MTRTLPGHPLTQEQSTKDKSSTLPLDPWEPVRDLRIRPDDRAFILGFRAGRNMDKPAFCQLVQDYSKRWRQAAARQATEGLKTYSGRLAANTWLREGAR